MSWYNNCICFTTRTSSLRPTLGGWDVFDLSGCWVLQCGPIGFSIATTFSVKWLSRTRELQENRRTNAEQSLTNEISVLPSATNLPSNAAERNSLCSCSETSMMWLFVSRTVCSKSLLLSNFKNESMHKMIIETRWDLANTSSFEDINSDWY